VERRSTSCKGDGLMFATRGGTVRLGCRGVYLGLSHPMTLTSTLGRPKPLQWSWEAEACFMNTFTEEDLSAH